MDFPYSSGLFGPKQQMHIINSIYPDAAKREVLQGRLPHLQADKLLLKNGEFCAYIDKAILNTHVKKKISTHTGVVMPGLFKGHRVHAGSTRPIEFEETKQVRGILYITNRRLIFQAAENAFEKTHGRLTVITPYSNAVVLQYGSQVYELIVSDGGLVYTLFRLLTGCG